MGCITSFSRFILFAFNIVCFLVGLAMLVLGIVYQLNFADFLENMEELNNIVSLTPILLIVIGAIVFVIAFFGCCGAVRKSSCMLMTYAIILIIILVLQVAFVIYVLVQAREDSGLKDNLYKALDSLFQNTDAVALETVDFIQTHLECCGFLYAPTTGIRESCCSSIVNDVCIPFTQGCWMVFYEFITDSMQILGIVAACLAGVELLGAIMAICIANSARRSQKYA